MSKSRKPKKRVSVRSNIKKRVVKGKSKKVKSVKKGSKRKPTSTKSRKVSENRYNSIKSAISSHYVNLVGRKIKRNELRILYLYIKERYSNQPLKYVLMNIDSIIDNFWTEYCNLYPIELSNFELAFEWYNIKSVFDYEKEFHYPADIIEIDLSSIDSGKMVFYAEEYAGKTDEFYEICKEKGLKRESPPPLVILKNAYCDVNRRGNVFEYYLSTDDDFPSDIPSVPKREGSTEIPKEPVKDDLRGSGIEVRSKTDKEEKRSETSQNEVEIEKLRLASQEEVKKKKIEELSKLLKEGVISFEQYLEALKEV
jgi:hypothetical protein